MSIQSQEYLLSIKTTLFFTNFETFRSPLLSCTLTSLKNSYSSEKWLYDNIKTKYEGASKRYIKKMLYPITCLTNTQEVKHIPPDIPIGNICIKIIGEDAFSKKKDFLSR